MPLPPTLIDSARSYGGVFSRPEAIELGVANHTLYYKLKAGQLHVRDTGVFSLGCGELDERGQLRVAFLANGPAAVLSHESALAHMLGTAQPAKIELTRPYGRGARSSTAVVHRTRVLDSGHFTEFNGFPMTTGARTLVDLSLRLTVRQLGARFDQLVALGHTDAEQLIACASRFSILAPQRKPIVAWLLIDEREDLSCLVESVLELEVLRALRDAGIPDPVPQYPLDLEGRSIRIDFAWVEQKVALEVDSQLHHSSRLAFDRDRDRDLRLIRAGWKPVRVSATQIGSDLVRTMQAVLGCA